MNFKEWRCINNYGPVKIHRHENCWTCKFRKGSSFLECGLAWDEADSNYLTYRVGRKSKCCRWEVRPS